MFERIEVWDRAPECVWIYVVFRNLKTGRFHVQQASAVYDSDLETMRKGLEHKTRMEIELFRETPPSRRSAGHATLAAAIARHKADFADMSGPTPLTQ